MGWRLLGFAHQICFMRRRLSARCLVFCCLAAGMLLVGAPARASHRPEIDAGFRLLYELKFSEARAQFAAWETLHPDDPLGAAAEAASHLFEEFHAEGVLTSEFFLDDKRLLGGIAGKADTTRGAAFKAANRRAPDLGARRRKNKPKDADAPFTPPTSICLSTDYA